jgi:hypothetical protein
MDAGLFCVGCTLGGSALGAGIGALFSLVMPHPKGSMALAAVAGIVAIVFELGTLKWSLPTIKRQVRRSWWFNYDSGAVSLAWGLEQGFGVLTRVNSAGLYFLIVAAALVEGPLLGALSLGLYGLVRGCEPLLALALYRKQPRSFVLTVASAQRLIRLSGAMAMFGFAILLSVGLSYR